MDEKRPKDDKDAISTFRNSARHALKMGSLSYIKLPPINFIRFPWPALEDGDLRPALALVASGVPWRRVMGWNGSPENLIDATTRPDTQCHAAVSCLCMPLGLQGELQSCWHW